MPKIPCSLLLMLQVRVPHTLSNSACFTQFITLHLLPHIRACSLVQPTGRAARPAPMLRIQVEKPGRIQISRVIQLRFISSLESVLLIIAATTRYYGSSQAVSGFQDIAVGTVFWPLVEYLERQPAKLNIQSKALLQLQILGC